MIDSTDVELARLALELAKTREERMRFERENPGFAFAKGDPPNRVWWCERCKRWLKESELYPHRHREANQQAEAGA